MPKKSKFIDKANSTHYHLLHRSHTDAAHAEEGVPSEFVLVASSKNDHKKVECRESAALSIRDQLHTTKDHINALGFKNDGYDYTKHLKEMGGGKFIGKDGKQAATPIYEEIELPMEALPSGVEMSRDYEAITIDHNIMDDDLHAALFDEADEDGEFEELDDDFCAQVMTDDASEGFDYDAHIASLIARSDRNTRGPVKETEKKRVTINVEEGEDEYEEFSEYDSGDDCGDDSGNTDLAPKLSSESQQQLDEQFEKTMTEYDDDELGYLDYVDDEELAGQDALEDDNAQLLGAMDDFLQEQLDSILADGTGVVKKGNRRMLLPERKPTTGDSWLPEGVEVDNATGDEPVDTKKEKESQTIAQIEAVDVLGEYGQTSNAKVNPDFGIEHSQQYMREEREQSEWDCESILSTYSTLDNHPKLIKSSNTKFQPYKSRQTKHLENVEAKESAVTKILREQGLIGGASSTDSAGAHSQKQTSKGPAQIVLGGKMGLPMEFSRGDAASSSSAATKSSTYTDSILLAPRSKRTVHIPRISEERPRTIAATSTAAEAGVVDGADSDASVSSDEKEEKKEWVKSKGGRKKETAEEKKQRKLQVKAEQREKRMQKKSIKEAFKSEGARIAKRAGTEQSIDHVSVYHYGNS